AARTGSRPWPDALAHPVSIALLDVLVARSLVDRRRGTLQWRGRPVTGRSDEAPAAIAPRP
ncbi:hypothetical protein A7K94_0213550, partial [Modestobacter sp. VKM Ac-2676]